MSHIDDNKGVIKELLQRPPSGLITDLDGTISPIAPSHRQATVSPLCIEYLADLRHYLTLVAVVSGRSVTIVKNMVGLDGIVYIGLHGMERWVKDHAVYSREVEDYVNLIQSAIKELAPVLATEGVYIEDKGAAASVHYRLSPQPETTRNQVMGLIRQSPHLQELRIVPGRMVIDILPPVTINKGTAVRELIRDYQLKGGIYLGDDVTDIDAFRAIHSASGKGDFKGWAVGITSPEMPPEMLPEVDFTLNGVAEVADFFRQLSRTARQLSG